MSDHWIEDSVLGLGIGFMFVGVVLGWVPLAVFGALLAGTSLVVLVLLDRPKRKSDE